MLKYTRVSYLDRCKIEASLEANIKVEEIARRLGFHRSTIYREVKRNGRPRCYGSRFAQAKARRRFRSCRRKCVIDHEMEKVLEKGLLAGWSPEQIRGYLKRRGRKYVSVPSMYTYLHKSELRKQLRRYNKRGGGRSRNRRRLWSFYRESPIQSRSVQAEQRKRVGDWERDTFYMKQRQVLVCVDRKSRYTLLEKVSLPLTADAVQKQTQRLLTQSKRKAFTLCNDNGPEFRSRKEIGIPIYFCKPRAPYQRGTVENTIGLLRQYLKRSDELEIFSNQDLKQIQKKLNCRPRKCLNFKTPYEIFHNKPVALAI